MIDRTKNDDLVFFAWTRISRRSDELARYFNAIYIRYNRWDHSRITLLFSLIINFWRTFFWIIINRPRIIFTFNAHPFITISAKIATWVTFKGHVIPDLHTAAITDNYHGLQKILARWIWVKCPLLLIHNQESKDYLSKSIPCIQKKIFVLEDSIPLILKEKKNSALQKPICILISRFADDEPIEEFLQAIINITNCQFFITGNYNKANYDLSMYYSDNITFTGFVSDKEYLSLLNSSDFITILTKREMTLLSGGYEALALEKPYIISKTRTLIDYFDNSAIYTENTVTKIQESVNLMLEEIDERKKNVSTFKVEKVKQWEKKASELYSVLKNLG